MLISHSQSANIQSVGQTASAEDFQKKSNRAAFGPIVGGIVYHFYRALLSARQR